MPVLCKPICQQMRIALTFHTHSVSAYSTLRHRLRHSNIMMTAAL